MKNATSYLLWANPKSIANSYEQTYYDSHACLFNVKTSLYNENRSIFDIIKSVAVLRGLENREILNKDYKQFPEEELKRKEIQSALLQQLPFFEKEGTRIYIPTYNIACNAMYSRYPFMLKGKENRGYLENENYDVINPFLEYGFSLLESPFTRLVKLDYEKEDIRVYYHVAFETMFFVKKDLSLALELPILDEKVQKQRDNMNLFGNLNIIAKDYFENDIRKMFADLKDKKLLSSALYEECMEEEDSYQKRKMKHAI